MVKKIRNALVSGHFFKKLFKYVKKKIDKVFNNIDKILGLISRKIVYSRGHIDNNKIFIMTFDNKYTCNASYIVDELLRQDLPVDIVWASQDGKKTGFPEKVRTVKRGSVAMFNEQASAKIWIDNALNCVWYGVPKKKEQIYINTWHGSMGIKRLQGNKTWMMRAKQCRKITNYCISNSVFEENVYTDTFWPDSVYLKYGHARNDILFDKEKHEEIREKVCKFFEIDTNKKILLYAPTFREDGDTSCFDIDYRELKKHLEERFGGEWVILVRLHFKNRKKILETEFNEWLKNAGEYPDMQELLAVVDTGITDYSSWAYDYVLTGRPMFIYATDIEKYNSDRGFYYSLYTTPFPVCTNNEELISAVDGFDIETYEEKRKYFLEEKGCYETGNAAKLTVEKLKEIMSIN